jgi:hypothetical protein
MEAQTMTKFEVTDAMVGAAVQAYIHMDIENYCDREAMRAAITAAIEASGILSRLDNCESRLWAVLHRDDGQDYKEGRRYLERHRPDLAARLDAHESEVAEFLAALNKESTDDQ